MKHLKNSLIVFAAVLAVTGLVTFSIPSLTQGQQSENATKKTEDVRVVNSPSEPVPVTGTVNVGNTVQFRSAIPAGAFSLSTTGEALLSGPDPEGTSYAITSLTLANGSVEGPSSAFLFASWSDTDCSSPSHLQNGPVVQMRPGETVHLSFPQPYIFTAQPGAFSCLRINGGIFVEVTVVGYRF